VVLDACRPAGFRRDVRFRISPRVRGHPELARRYLGELLDRSMDAPAYAVVLSQADPLAEAVATALGTGEALGEFVDGVPFRELRSGAVTLRRSGLHIHDEHLDAKFPEAWRLAGTALVFPSVHRSERGDDALTVHPLGNPGPSALVGGRAQTFTPTAPRLMADALRKLAEGSGAVGWPATFEATHHGPELGCPAFFVEVGGHDPDHPPASATRVIADVVRGLTEDRADRVALGVGGGHYAPHFTDLTLRRSLAFGHILARHVLDDLTLEAARAAWTATPGAVGVVYARAADAERPVARAWGPRFREAEATRRADRSTPKTSPSGGVRSAGT
jgi:D-tyrosyl-tRNA(Tyr) deacylase